MTPMVMHLEMRSFAKWLWHLRRDMEIMIFSARYGGEEFAMILPKRGIEEAAGIAENIRKKFEELLFRQNWGKAFYFKYQSCGIYKI